MAGARRLHAELWPSGPYPFPTRLLPVPDINIVCYVIRHPSHRNLVSLNAFNERVFGEMSLARKRGPRTTSLPGPGLRARCMMAPWGRFSMRWKSARSMNGKRASEGLVVLRSTVMDPFLDSPGSGPDHVAGYLTALREACSAALSPPHPSVPPLRLQD